MESVKKNIEKKISIHFVYLYPLERFLLQPRCCKRGGFNEMLIFQTRQIRNGVTVKRSRSDAIFFPLLYVISPLCFVDRRGFEESSHETKLLPELTTPQQIFESVDCFV